MNQRELRRRQRRRQRRKRAVLLTVCLVVILGGILWVAWFLLTPYGEEKTEKKDILVETESQSGSETETDSQEETQPPVEETELPMMPGLEAAIEEAYSAHGEVIRVSDGAVIARKGENERTYPASLTKIMTTLVAIEHLENLQEEITLQAEMFESLYAQDASMAGFAPGETVTAMDLLYGIMLPSGAESGIALAEQIAGSEEGFVELMNQKAAELGMEDTHFTNSSGLHDENHYTTVHDLGILLQEALKNETFREIFTTRSYTTTPTQENPSGITFEASVFKNMNEDQSARATGVIQGGKTGYTQEAGLCLASMGLVGGEEFLVITTGAEGSHETVQWNIEDALNLYAAIGLV